ncbi:hypothetical protein ABT369_39230 [Dactylosporangium sp. NPDC000244]|uniref:hypothetical protein n=1 Tax=Dactylosporangium sp. NPDC000244 TaxID=3154365 RepID=UPI0033168FC5
MLIADLPTNDDWSAYDWSAVLKPGPDDYGSSYTGAHWAPLGGPAPDITADRIARIHGWQASSPEGGGSRNFACVVELTDGTWAACMAWADYTGWGCQDGVEWRVAADLPSIVSYGLDCEGRQRLELTAGGAG